ncbi:MAG: hypothetical protein K6A63_08805 [Acholeplasmatales bacterium]|nr:hypothetical protein [Acholeplasmatales bacterium]
MIIKYEFANGDVSEVEVTEEFGNQYKEMEKEFENDERKWRYWVKQSLDDYDYEGDWEQDESLDPCEKAILDESKRRIEEFYKTLTEVQLRRLKLREEGYSFREISRIENVEHKAITKTFNQIKNKYLKFFSK